LTDFEAHRFFKVEGISHLTLQLACVKHIASLSSLLKSVQKDLECFLISVGVKVQPGRPHREREWDPDPRKENAIRSGTSRSSSFYFFYSRRGEIINSIRCQLFPETSC
jgi:hypothetical protein